MVYDVMFIACTVLRNQLKKNGAIEHLPKINMAIGKHMEGHGVTGDSC